MNTKLTLKMDEKVIESAKDFAKSQHTSLSKLAENFFRSITSTSNNKLDKKNITGVVGELAGVLKNSDLDEDRSDYINYLENKYK
ncbi:MAG: DUF6364 family protein [Planctomycetota bacterium]|jgi:hypothetical protein